MHIARIFAQCPVDSYAVRIEILQSYLENEEDGDLEELMKMCLGVFATYATDDKPETLAQLDKSRPFLDGGIQKLHQQQPGAFVTILQLKKSRPAGVDEDFEEHNFMFRKNGTIVIADPWV